MIPAPSLWGTTRFEVSGFDLRDLTSEGFTPEVTTLTNTSPAPGLGLANSPTISTSFAVPFRSYQAAFMLQTPLVHGVQMMTPHDNASKPQAKRH
jgi:hypothetical protein